LLDDDFINITSIAHVDANGEVRIDQADLHALSDLLEEYERNLGSTTPQDHALVLDPAPVRDNEECWNEYVIYGWHTVRNYLSFAFHNYPPDHECETVDHLIWILENKDCVCAEIQRWMYFHLFVHYASLEELREDFDNRPWVNDKVKFAFFDKFFNCFSGEDLELKYTDAEINADVILSLVPVESDICPYSPIEVNPYYTSLYDVTRCSEGTSTFDPYFKMMEVGVDWLL